MAELARGRGRARAPSGAPTERRVGGDAEVGRLLAEAAARAAALLVRLNGGGDAAEAATRGLLAQPLGCDAEVAEHLAAVASRVGDDRQQDVVRAELLAAGVGRVVQGRFEDALRPRREGPRQPGDPRLVALADPLDDLLARRVVGDALDPRLTSASIRCSVPM
jgi:hypothetical protein